MSAFCEVIVNVIFVLAASVLVILVGYVVCGGWPSSED